MENLNNWIIATNDFIWTYILIALLICIGVYFTFKSKFVQFRNIREMFRLLGDGIASGNHKNSVSSFQAFCIATASRVGTGNLAGVATALALGGPGAIFWMWLIALIGSASAFIESTLAQIYKVKGERSFIGGPAFYMEKGSHTGKTKGKKHDYRNRNRIPCGGSCVFDRRKSSFGRTCGADRKTMESSVCHGSTAFAAVSGLRCCG